MFLNTFNEKLLGAIATAIKTGKVRSIEGIDTMDTDQEHVFAQVGDSDVTLCRRKDQWAVSHSRAFSEKSLTDETFNVRHRATKRFSELLSELT